MDTKVWEIIGGAIGGGFGIKLIEYIYKAFMSTKTANNESFELLRDSWSKEIKRIGEEMEKLKRENKNLADKYIEITKDHIRLKGDYDNLKNNNETLLKKYNELLKKK